MPDCGSCDELRKEANQAPLRHMDDSQDECRRCPLFRHRTRSPIPEGTEFAWAIAQFLSGAGVKRFGLRKLAVELLDLDSLDEHELAEVIDLLNAVAEGERKALKEINKPKPVKK